MKGLPRVLQSVLMSSATVRGQHYRADGVRITHDPFAAGMAEKYGAVGQTDAEGFDPYRDSVGPGIYGGVVKRDAGGAVVVGRQYQNHNPRPGPVYAGGGYTPINRALGDRLFRLLVLRPLNVEQLEKLNVRSLSGGEMQRVAIVICLGTPANVYLIDEPSAGLDCEQRIAAARVMKRWIVSHLGKTAFVIEHDFVMASTMADRIVVYTGNPGIECTAHSPVGLADGFNRFLAELQVTFRRDPANLRPRINKRGSLKDAEQKASGVYYLFDAPEDDD